MGHTQRTEKEARDRKIKAVQALKFGTVEPGTLAFWVAMGDRDAESGV